jgi:CubicO group peptidase (beta-lactamase class C family)
MTSPGSPQSGEEGAPAVETQPMAGSHPAAAGSQPVADLDRGVASHSAANLNRGVARGAWRLSLGVVVLAAAFIAASFPARPGWSASPRGEVHGALGGQLDRYLSRLEAFGFSGSLLVARHGRILIDKGYGLADREHGVAYTADTLFDVASISKQFTAAAVLKLEMAGRLKVEDTLGKFFSGVPPDKARITLHQLLTHTAGIPDTLGDEYEPISRPEMLRRALASPLVLPPGQHYRYSNAGYSLLAAVVEVVSGQPLGDYLRQHLFLPAGMRHTGHRLPLLDRRPLAHGYTRDGADWGTPLDHPWAPDGPWWNLRGNGGILSTTGDLYRWHLALAGNSILSAPEREKYTTPYVSEGRQSHSRYAYGWSVSNGPDGTRQLSHTGGNLVYEADFRRYVDDEAVIVISSNGADFSAITVSPHVEARLFGHPDADPPAPAPVGPEVTARCAGDYALASGERLRVEDRGGKLSLVPQGTQGFTLLAGGTSADEREIGEDHDQKVAAVLEPWRAGDYKPLSELVGLPLADARKLAQPALAELLRSQGAWSGAAVLGSTVLGGHVLTYARFNFERGTRFAEFLWEGPTVESIRYTVSPPGFLFVPVAPPPAAGSQAGTSTSAPAPRTQEKALPDFSSFDVRDGTSLRVHFEAGPDGNAIALVIPTPAGAQRLPRIVG